MLRSWVYAHAIVSSQIFLLFNFSLVLLHLKALQKYYQFEAERLRDLVVKTVHYMFILILLFAISSHKL